MCHHTWLIFIFLVKMWFHHVGQAGLELLTSSDLPALASQSAGITDMSLRLVLQSLLEQNSWVLAASLLTLPVKNPDMPPTPWAGLVSAPVGTGQMNS